MSEQVARCYVTFGSAAIARRARANYIDTVPASCMPGRIRSLPAVGTVHCRQNKSHARISARAPDLAKISLSQSEHEDRHHYRTKKMNMERGTQQCPGGGEIFGRA
jgi:hypothetical protein